MVGKDKYCTTTKRLFRFTFSVGFFIDNKNIVFLFTLLSLTRPFYRTTQLIIIPDNQNFFDQTYFTPSMLGDGTVRFGPAFDHDFLLRVLDLQTKVLKLTANTTDKNETIHLNDICLKPLSPDNNNCTVYSLLQYYQNSQDNLNKKYEDPIFDILYADYGSHFVACAQAPNTMNDTIIYLSCFGDFCAPINPYMFLGNYTDNTYTEATALVITIVIENSLDPAVIAKGLFIKDFF